MLWRVVLGSGFVLAAAVWIGLQNRRSSPVPDALPTPAPAQADPSKVAAILTNIPPGPLNLSTALTATLYARQVMDLWQLQFHSVEVEFETPPKQLGTPRPVNQSFVHVAQTHPDEAALVYQRSLPDDTVPLRGYRAPLFTPVVDPLPVFAPDLASNSMRRKTAELLGQRLAYDGLLPTLAQALQLMGVTSVTADLTRVTKELEAAGFPVDLLACFLPAGSDPSDPHGVIRYVVGLLGDDNAAASLTNTLLAVPLAWPRHRTGFEVASESGEQDLGLLRSQLGGGYRNGVVPGGALDLILQLLTSVPDVDFLVSVPLEHVDSFKWMCGNFSGLSREGQAVIVPEPLESSAWAQDNGKGGFSRDGGSGPARWTTLVPRYACKGEGSSAFLPGDTFLMARLVGAGHPVIQSRLLFQGGNILAVLDPATKRRFLLVSEPEVCRNMALGLTRAQVMTAFATEFGVDQCVVVPSASFHIDFDLSLRSHNGKMLVFVNDSQAAARVMVDAGLEALAVRGIASAAIKSQVSAALAAGDVATAVTTLGNLLKGHKNPRGQYTSALTRCFSGGKVDSASGNFRSFLLACEILASKSAHLPVISNDPLLPRYLEALRHIEKFSLAQQEILHRLGWQIVRIPSTPDFNDGVNYLNGIHDRTRYIIPVHGGFYKNLDAAASAAFAAALGPSVRLVPVVSAEAQRRHGAVHCATSAFPRVSPQ